MAIKFSETLRCAEFFLLTSLLSSYNLSKDYGAVGDGVHDDTAAIKLVFFFFELSFTLLTQTSTSAAIVDQGRCGGGSCKSST